MSENTTERLTDYPELLTVEEVAALLNTDIHGALDATGNGALRAIEIGTTIRRYPRQDVHNYLRSRSENRAPALG
jgi:excisionase family DNA binding protein